MGYSDDFMRGLRSASNGLIDELGGSSHLEVDPVSGELIWCATVSRASGDGDDRLKDRIVSLITEALAGVGDGAPITGWSGSSSKGRGRKRRNGSDPDVSVSVRVFLRGDL